MKLVIAFLVLFSLLAVSSTAEKFDFFYLVQQVMHHACRDRRSIDRSASHHDFNPATTTNII
jgi:hypothetical protein